MTSDEQSGPKNSTTVDPTLGYFHAKFTFYSNLNTIEVWRGAVLSKVPALIYDLSGRLLFYQFAVRRNFEIVGEILVSGDERLGAPVINVEPKPSAQSLIIQGEKAQERADLVELAVQKALEVNPGAQVLDAYVVCYAYPKLGIQVDLAEPDAQWGGVPLTFILDIATRKQVVELPEGTGGGELDGNEAYSLLQMAERQPELGEDDDAQSRDMAIRATRKKFGDMSGSMLDLLEAYEESEGGGGLVEESREVVLPDRILSQSGDFPLIPQIDTYHCALASAEMIISYLDGDAPTQTELEAPFKKGPFGTTNKNQIRGYKAILNDSGFLPLPLDSDPTPPEIQQSIDNNMPMKSGVPSHARVCAGYRVSRYPATERHDGLELFEMLIHDPWPPNEGAKYWESWTSILHKNCIYFGSESN
jgi:hypothetical protein